MSRSRRVYPVDGFYLNGVPHVEHDCEDPVCTESGAFTHDPPAEAEPQPEDPPSGGSLDSKE